MKRNVLFFLIVWLGIGCISEAGIRLYEFLGKSERPPSEYTSHRSAIFIPHPFQVYASNPDHSDHTLDGFRGENERPGPNNQDTFKIVCMGGSSTYGSRVFKEDSYPCQLGEALSRQVQKSIQVINAGVGGYSTPNIISLLALRIVHLKPQVVIFYAGYNDVWNRLLFSGFQPDYSHALKPWSKPGLPWWRHSRLLDRLAELLGRPYDKNPHIHQVAWKSMSGRPADNWKRSSGVPFRNNLRTVVSIARAHSARPVLVTQATDFMNHPTRGDKDAWMRAMGEYTDIIKEVAGELDVLMIDIRGQMSDQKPYFADVLHMNKTGNRERARIIAEFILSHIEI